LRLHPHRGNSGRYQYQPDNASAWMSGSAPGEICNQPPMRAVPKWPSFLTHRTVEPLRVSL
jgi:hypothetical protein